MSIPHNAPHFHGASYLHAPPPLPPPQYIPVSGPDAADAIKYRRTHDAEELPHYKMRLDRADEGYHCRRSRIPARPIAKVASAPAWRRTG